MEGFIYVAIVIAIILILALFEYKSYNILYTPYILFACPYACVLVFQFIAVQIYDLTDISLIYIMYLLEHLFIVWLVDTVFIYFSGLRKRHEDEKRNWNAVSLRVVIEENIDNSMVAKVISGIGIGCSVYLLLNFIIRAFSVNVIGSIVQAEFQNGYSGGLNFYFRLIAMIATVYFFTLTDSNNLKYAILGILCLLPNVLTFVKGIIFLCVVAGVIGNIIYHNRKIRLSQLLFVAICGVSIFLCVYLVEICIWDPLKLFQLETYQSIFSKFIVYVVAGVQGFNEQIVQNNNVFSGVDNPVYAPIINALAKTGIVERIDTVSDVWINIGSLPNYGEMNTNVYSYAGMLVLYCGNLQSILVGIVIALIQVILFVKAVKSRKLIYLLMYSLFATAFFLGWFSYYFVHTFWVYLIILACMLVAISRFIVVARNYYKLLRSRDVE